ncbi:DUF2490 domain-containing protein [Cytophagaceae bacterium ABcell3]|nr:DUF2490 domain-containing protein [Cytophagaceae bacterium ABcell3]
MGADLASKLAQISKAFYLFLALSFSTSYFVQAQVPDRKIVYPHTLLWNKLEVAEIIENTKFGIGFDAIHRRSNELGTGTVFDRHLRTSVRPWVHYQFSPYARLSVSPLGYFHSNEYAALEADLERPTFHELRSTIQFFHHHPMLGGRIMHTWRYRYEFRNQYQPGSESYRFFTRFRFRYRIRVMLNTPDFYTPGTIYAAVSNEIGLNIGRNVVMNTFNQNRVYAGIGYRFLNAMRVELRYLDRFRTRGATGFEFDHGRGIMIALNIDQLTYIGRRYTRPIQYAD